MSGSNSCQTTGARPFPSVVTAPPSTGLILFQPDINSALITGPICLKLTLDLRNYLWLLY